MEVADRLRDVVDVRELEAVAVAVALDVGVGEGRGTKDADPEAEAAAELERLGLCEGVLLLQDEEVLREERVPVPVAPPDTVAEPVACAEALGAVTVGAAVTLEEMVSVSDTSVGTGEPVEAALPLALSVPTAVPRALPVALTLEEVLEEGVRAALRETEGEAVAVGLTLGLPVPLEESGAARLALAVAQAETLRVAVPLSVARATVRDEVRLADAEEPPAGVLLAESETLLEEAILPVPLRQAVTEALREAVVQTLGADVGAGSCEELHVVLPLMLAEREAGCVCVALEFAVSEALALPDDDALLEVRAVALGESEVLKEPLGC